MSVFIARDKNGKPKSPFYQYSFQIGGRAFQGSCRTPSKREAQQIERTRRVEAEAELASAARGESGRLSFDEACIRYGKEILDVNVKNAKNRQSLKNALVRLAEHFGLQTQLADITTARVQALIDERRRETRWGRSTTRHPATGEEMPGRAISNATINRLSIQPLRYLLDRARDVWGVRDLPHIEWKKLGKTLRERREIPREVLPHEEGIFEKVLPPHYQLVAEFARVSGLRASACLLRKDEVVGDSIYVTSKGKKLRKTITDAMRAILMEAMANPTDHCFAIKRGPSYRPIKPHALKQAWLRARRLGMPLDLRFHDLRHDFGTKLLRQERDLKKVSKALDHANITTTARYAHVLDEEVVDAMNRLGRYKVA